MRRILVSLFASLIVFTSHASDKGDPRQKVLDASHSSRINDVDMKPWNLKVNFHLSGRDGQPSEDGTIEEWWAGLTTWKLRIDSPSYTSTVIENGDGDFRTESVGPIPLRIQAIEQDIVYPIPMGEDLSKTVPHTSHQKLEKATLDCTGSCGHPGCHRFRCTVRVLDKRTAVGCDLGMPDRWRSPRRAQCLSRPN